MRYYQGTFCLARLSLTECLKRYFSELGTGNYGRLTYCIYRSVLFYCGI